MDDNSFDSYDPYQHLKEFYKLNNPTEEEQFRFVEAMDNIINTSPFPEDRLAGVFNLAVYYRNIKEFQLEKKYLEIGKKMGDAFCKEQLGFIWYYGLCGELDYKKAYRYFKDCGTRNGLYMIADMYHKGQCVDRNDYKCREILEDLMLELEDEKDDSRFVLSTVFPEVAVRLAKLNIETQEDSLYDLENLFDARDILAKRQQRRPFWGNIKTMQDILDATVDVSGNDYEFIDLYDLLTFEAKNGTVTFDYEEEIYQIDIFEYEGNVVYQFMDKWYHGAEDFLEKAMIEGDKITTVYDLILDIQKK